MKLNRSSVAFTAIFTLILAALNIAPVNARIVDFAITSRHIITLQNDGSLRVSTYSMWTEVMSLTHFTPLASPGAAKVVALTVTRDSVAIILLKNGDLYALDKGTSWKALGRYNSKSSVHALLAADTAHVYIVGTKGITNIKTGKTFYHSPGPDTAYTGKWSRPSATCFFGGKKIWVAFDYGEFGGAALCFNTITECYESTNWRTDSLGLLPIQSFFEVKEQLYFSMGLQHFFKHGIIARLVGDSVATVFYSGPDVSHRPKIYDDGEYIGPAAFDSRKKQIVYYSQNGFSIGDINTDLAQSRMWMKIANPQLHWEKGRSDALGSPMNVYVIKYVGPGQFFFLTKQDGLGFYGFGAVRFYSF